MESLHYHYYQQYENALDELRSQIAPEQFAYLFSVLASPSAGDTASTTIKSESGNDSSILRPSSSWSTSKGLQSSSTEDPSSSSCDNVQQHFANYRARVKSENEKVLLRGGTQQLVLPGLRQIGSFDSTRTTLYTAEPDSLISRYGVTSKGSVSALEVEESLLENVILAQQKYEQVSMPLVVFPGESHKLKRDDGGHHLHKTCSQMPVCKRISGRYAIPGVRSRSSSVETVKAESLPDLDNPLLSIAGKIANEPVNPFPVLKKFAFKKASRTNIKRGLGKDIHRVEDDIDRELDKFQDYKNVSDFFGRKLGERKATKAKHVSGVVNLSRRVTNPLYKVYDPSGYQKSEDELALECIDMICNDFNKWIKSLADSKRKDEIQTEVEDENKEQDAQSDLFVLGPEFLLKILRKDLELPEEFIK